MSYKNFKRDLSNYVGGGIVVTGLALGGASLAHAQQPTEKYTFAQVRDSVNAGTIPEDMREDARWYVLNLTPGFINTFGDPRKGGLTLDDKLPEKLGIPTPDTSIVMALVGRVPTMYAHVIDQVHVGRDSIRAELFKNLDYSGDKWNFLILKGRYPTGESFDIRGSLEDWRKKVNPEEPGSKEAYDALTAYIRTRDFISQEPERRKKAAK